VLVPTIIITAAIISLILTDLIKRYSIKRNLIDIPVDRSLHDIPVPRLGGIAILTVWFPGLTLFYLLDIIELNLFLALLSGLPIALISIIDDIKNISYLVRLIVHFGSAALAFYFLDFLRPFYTFNISFNYSFLLYPLAIIGMVWFINLFNFMDGVDGFAAVEAIFISSVLFVFSNNVLLILLIAIIIGFLFWNLPKAEIFLGDTGSTQFGFILIVLGIYFHNNLELSILNWIMIAAPFWFDASFTLFRRWRNKENLKEAHRKHAYQRIVQYGFSHRRILFVLILINAIIFGLIMLYREFNMLKPPLTLITIIGIYILYKMVDKRVPFSNKH
jgi:UDP-N-acetylmuramyl pentapeptide phosphotransferase/UDP-N-acetylglucosamine-1-phosphate transferase